MENPDSRKESISLFNDGLDDIAKGYLIDTAKWAKFLAVVSFIFLGLGIVGIIFFAFSFARTFSPFGMFGGGALAAIYILVGVLYFFPTYYLFRFATTAKPALRAGDSSGLTTSLGYLRAAFRFVGIMLLVILAIYGVFILIALIGLAFSR